MPKVTQQVCVDCPDPQPQCPEPCCAQIPNPILCIAIPCPIQIVLLGGIVLNLNLPCLSLGSESPLTPEQIATLLAILRFLQNLLGDLPVPGTAAAEVKAEA